MQRHQLRPIGSEYYEDAHTALDGSPLSTPQRLWYQVTEHLFYRADDGSVQ